MINGASSKLFTMLNCPSERGHSWPNPKTTTVCEMLAACQRCFGRLLSAAIISVAATTSILSRDKHVFVATKTFVVTKIVVVATTATDSQLRWQIYI